MGGDQGSGRAGTATGRDSHGCNGSRPPERGGIRAGSPSGRDSRREGKWEGKVKGSLSGEGGFDDQKSSFPRLAIPPVRRRRCARRRLHACINAIRVEDPVEWSLWGGGMEGE